jgi:hypothetical protein
MDGIVELIASTAPRAAVANIGIARIIILSLTFRPSEYLKAHQIWAEQGESIIIRTVISNILLDCFDQTTVHGDHLQGMEQEHGLMIETLAVR